MTLESEWQCRDRSQVCLAGDQLWGRKALTTPQNVGKGVYDLIKQMIRIQNLTHRIQTLKIHTRYISCINNSKEIYNVKGGSPLDNEIIGHSLLVWKGIFCNLLVSYELLQIRIHTESKGKKEIFGPASLNYQIPRTFHSLNEPVVTHEGALGGIPPKQWLLRGNNHRRGLQHFGWRLFFLLKFY